MGQRGHDPWNPSEAARTVLCVAKQQHVEKSGPMAGHVRRGRLFVPEFAATVDLAQNDWFRDDVPDYLWPLMIAESQGNSSLIRFVRWQGAVQANLKDLVPARNLAAGLDGRLTSLDRLAALNDTAADVMLERAIEYYLLTDSTPHIFPSTRLLSARPAPSPTHSRLGRAASGASPNRCHGRN